jgi:Na+/H+-dicarboxylate symporter
MRFGLPAQLILSLLAAFFFQPFLSMTSIQFFYSVSTTLKGFLVILLPFVIMFYIASAVLVFNKKAPVLMILTFLFIILSNGTAVITSYIVSLVTLPFIASDGLEKLDLTTKALPLLWNFSVKGFLGADKALLIGLLLGFLSNISKLSNTTQAFIFKGKTWITLILKKVFIPFIPFYIFGFVLKLRYDGSLEIMITHYVKVMILSLCLIVFYIFGLYMLASRGSLKKALAYIKEMMPAAITGFSTMSSAMAMPLTLNATEKNVGDTEYARFFIPTTLNPHMTGDNLVIPMTAFFLSIATGQGMPDFKTFLLFLGMYCITKFSAAGVPGGGVLIILPVVEKYLHLSESASAILATIYILQDSVFSMTNIMANGASAIFTFRWFKKWIR